MKPIKKLAFGRLFFNKGLYQYHDAFYLAFDELRRSGLIDTPVIITRNGDPVDLAREKCVDEMYANDCDAIVWVDTDLIIPPDAFVRLVSMSNAGMPIAGGIYRRAMTLPEQQFILTRIDKPEWATLEELRAAVDGGVTKVAITAGGFTIVRREVYDLLRKKNGPPWYACYDPERDDWPVEDTYFYRRVHAANIPVYVDPELHAIHWSHFGPVPVEAGELEAAGIL